MNPTWSVWNHGMAQVAITPTLVALKHVMAAKKHVQKTVTTLRDLDQLNGHC